MSKMLSMREGNLLIALPPRQSFWGLRAEMASCLIAERAHSPPLRELSEECIPNSLIQLLSP